MEGPASRYFSDAGNSATHVCSIVPISDSPVGTKYAAQTVITKGAAGVTRSLCFYSAKGVPLTPGKKYRLSCWYRVTAYTSGTIGLRMQFGNTKYTNSGYLVNNLKAKTDWAYMDWVFTAPEIGEQTYTDGSARIYGCYVVSVAANTTATVQCTGFDLHAIE